MKVNGHVPVDPACLIPAYIKEGLDVSLLRKCNSQTYRAINGYGEGWFLFTSDQKFENESEEELKEVSLEIADTANPSSVYTTTLQVLDLITLTHPSQSLGFTVLHTAEEKYKLKRSYVTRNYNMIDRASIVPLGTIQYYEPDNLTQKNLRQIIADISGLTVSQTALRNYTPFECNIQGYNVFDAIEWLCASFGFYWTMHNNQIRLLEGSQSYTPSPTKINDIRTTKLNQRLNNFNFCVPVVAKIRQSNSRITAYANNQTYPGESVTLYNHFAPACMANDEIQVNDTGATSPQDIGEDVYNSVAAITKLHGQVWAFEEYSHSSLTLFSVNNLAVFAYATTFADYGAGPRTILSSVRYPFPHIPTPYVFDNVTAVSGTGKTVVARFVLTTELSRGSGSTAIGAVTNTNDDASPSTITVVSRGSEVGFIGASGIAVKVEVATDTFEWWIVKLNQPAMRVVAKLAAHPASYGGVDDSLYRFGADPREAQAAIDNSEYEPYGLTEYPFSFIHESLLGTSPVMVANPFGKFGESGDWAILDWDRSNSEYILTEVIPAKARELWGELTSDRVNGLDVAIYADYNHPICDGSLSIASTAYDLFNVAVNAKIGDKVLIRRIPSIPGYVAVGATHVARRIRGTIQADFHDRPATFRFLPDTPGGMDGRNPEFPIDGETEEPLDYITVQNRYGWEAGSEGQKVEVLWDTHTGEWYPANMECPGDPTPIYF